MAHSGVGLVVALAAEARVLARRPRLGRIQTLDAGTLLYVSGMGLRAASDAAAALADSGVAALAMIGVGGGLDPALASGALLCPAEVVDDLGHRYPCDSGWRSRLAARLGSARDLIGAPLLTVREPLLTPQDKAAARQRCGAAVVDMECAAVAAIALERGLPFLALRAVADGAGDSIPAPLAGAIDRWGRARPLGVAAALLRHPGLIPRLPHLAGTMKLATLALREAVQAAGPALAYND